MFRPSPFSLTDLDMWDTKSRFTAQSAAWCGLASVSGTGFMSNVSTSTSGSTGGFRQNDPGLRKWQSLSHLAAEGAPRSFPPLSPGAELRAARAEGCFRQAGVGEWLHDAHEHLDSQLDRLRDRNSQLSYNITAAQLLDMKHKQQAIRALEQQKEAAELSKSEKSRQQRGDFNARVLQLEKNLLQMRSTLDREGNDQPTVRSPDSLGGTSASSHEDLNGHERHSVDTELCKLREALRDAETRAKKQEEERNQALQELQASTETQRMLLKQIEEMNQRLSLNRQNHTEVQEQLSEANNKISEACLEKAVLSTQVLKLEENIKELEGKLRERLSDKDHLDKEKAHLHARDNKQEILLLNKESEALKEVNAKLTRELNTSQSQLRAIAAERDTDSKRITDLKAQCSQLIREKEELLGQMNQVGHEEVAEVKEKCLQLSKSTEGLELEKLKLHDRCTRLEAEVCEKEEKLHMREEEHRTQDAVRVRSNEELKAMVSHWTEKWQKVALALQSTQEELEGLKKNTSRAELQLEALRLESEIEKLKNQGRRDKEEIEMLLQQRANMETLLTKMESDSPLWLELDAIKQELELERKRNGSMVNRYEHNGGHVVHTLDKQTETDLSESSLLWEPPSDSHCSQNKDPQAHEECPDNVDQVTVSLTSQLEDSRRRVEPLLRPHTSRQNHTVKDDKPPVEVMKDKSVHPVDPETEQQRRMVTEQLKSLFKEREGKETGKMDNVSAAAQAGSSSLQDWTPPSKVVRNAAERRSWHHGSGLMPVFEEDEENIDWPTEKMTTVNAEIIKPNAENKNLLPATLRCEQTIQEHPQIATKETTENCFGCEVSIDLQEKTPIFLYPDGTFLAELVDICSPNEDEEDG